MLAVMTYHVFLVGAIVLGAGIGYFLFASFVMRDLPQACPQRPSPGILPLSEVRGADNDSGEATQELLDAQI